MLQVLRRTKKTGKQLGGRPKAADWGMCAAVLHAYLKLSTGEPHWVSIVRLLRSAHPEDFGFEVAGEGERRIAQVTAAAHDPAATYADMVKKRVRRFRRSPASRSELDNLARGYNMMFGGDGIN